MVTRRVSGPLFITCGHCGARFGPYSRVQSGSFKCGKCGKTFFV